MDCAALRWLCRQLECPFPYQFILSFEIQSQNPWTYTIIQTYIFPIADAYTHSDLKKKKQQQL